MLGFNRKYCEVIPEQPIVEHWREIKLDTGALQSTLQDVKVRTVLFFIHNFSNLSKYEIKL